MMMPDSTRGGWDMVGFLFYYFYCPRGQVGETAKLGVKTNYYSLKPGAFGLDINLYNFPKHQWAMDTNMWPGIKFPDIYMLRISFRQTRTDCGMTIQNAFILYCISV